MSSDLTSAGRQPMTKKQPPKPMKILARSLTNRSLPLRGVFSDEAVNSPTTSESGFIDHALVAKFVKRCSQPEPRAIAYFNDHRPASTLSTPSASIMTRRSSQPDSDTANHLKRMSRSATNLRIISSAPGHPKQKREESQKEEEEISSGGEDVKVESPKWFPDDVDAETHHRPRSQTSGRPYTPFEIRTPKTTALYKVLEFLHCGNIESAFNAQLLCRLRIGYLLDATGLDPSKMPRNIRNSLPCMCKAPNSHIRNEMALEIDDSTAPNAIVAVFTEVNRFIMAARAQGKQVLIYSEDGRNSNQALAIQYIMSYHNLPVIKAIAYFETNCMPVRLTNNFRTALALWEKQLREKADKNREESIRALRSNQPTSKNAWN
uniref:protein-tyrosine-phosphatase n=1 Tax=Plectus sambesii TaxID=2011161 RepID=A0A914WTD8_9BILA